MGTSLRWQRLWSSSALRNCNLLQDVEDGDHPLKGLESGAMDPQYALDKFRDSYLYSIRCRRRVDAVARLKFCMNRMLTEGKLSLTTRAWLKLKLEVERVVRLVLIQSMDIRGDFPISGEWLRGWPRIFSRGAQEDRYLREVAASLSEYIGSFLDMWTLPTEAEEDLLRKKRDEEARLLSALAELALLYLHLVGLIDRGGTRTYSSGSLLFSSTFVSIVLVLAFYVWFKSRAAPRRGYHRSSPSGLITIEARYKPPGASGNFYLGVCADDEEAGTKQEIAACYYDRHSRWLAIKDREERFEIPLTPSVPANLDAAGKRRWVKTRVMEVYEEFKSFAASLPSLPVAFDPDVRLEDMDQDLFDNPEAMFDSLAVETQHVPGAVPIMFPGAGGHHSEVAVGGGAAQVILQSKNTSLDVVQQLLESISWLVQQNGEKDRRLAEHETRFADYDRQLAEQGRRFADNARLNEELARVVTELKRDNERLRSISQF